MNSAIPESRLENMATVPVVLRVLGNCQIHDAECLRIRDAICPNSLCHLTILLIHPLPVSDTQGMACASQRRRPLHCPLALLQHVRGTQIESLHRSAHLAAWQCQSQYQCWHQWPPPPYRYLATRCGMRAPPTWRRRITLQLCYYNSMSGGGLQICAANNHNCNLQNATACKCKL